MLPTHQGSVRLFQFSGITVWLHWSWLVIAMWAVSSRMGRYHSPIWNLIEYLTLFGIVLLHEFGHSLACRQVGGQADRIVLWPLGGVAYVNPPFRPGAQLWSIVAGPLVNLVLIPVFFGLLVLTAQSGLASQFPDLWFWLRTTMWINVYLLIFNLLPIFPLDGGQILRSVLWFRIGPRRSLLAATVVGLVGCAGLLALALWWQSIWMGILTLFIGSNCWQVYQSVRNAGNRS
jgi:Zn-dependent protease